MLLSVETLKQLLLNQVARQLLQQHKKNEMDFHLTLLMNELRVVKEKHREQVKRLEDELEDTKREVS